MITINIIIGTIMNYCSNDLTNNFLLIDHSTLTERNVKKYNFVVGV